MSSLRWIRSVATLAALAAALLIGAEDAGARLADGLSVCGRGGRVFTLLAVNAAAGTMPVARDSATAPPTGRQAYPQGSLGGLFNRPGLVGGFAAGFLGCGLLGLLFGQGLFGELGGAASFLGLTFQLALLAMLGRLIWTRWHGGPTAAFADLSPRQLADAYIRARSETLPGFDAPACARLDLTESDYDCFARLLGEIETAYGRADLDALRTRVTPQMMGYFSETLARNAGRGVIHAVSDVKLMKGDLAEAWREGDIDYAAVAMRGSLVDHNVERVSGIVDGSDASAIEATQVWTFSRARGDRWLLAAIQQGS